MKTLHFECLAGISGDMALGAFVDLGVDPNAVRAGLGKLGLEGWKLDFVRDERNGITGTRAIVDLGASHNHDAHDSTERHRHEHHEHRHWKDIRALIQNAPLSAGAKARALDIFGRIAEAEAQVHGKPVDEVAFHEVGALDSIVDIVGTAVCLDILGPDRITSGGIELGGGTVKCAHGVLPVPAPATLILCRGLPVKTGGFDREMTTPTGAAILAASVDTFTETASFTEIKTGYGIGGWKLERPNVLRLSLREEAVPETALWDSETLTLIETNIDDMTGEALGFLMERLFEEGALDVTFSPCTMKKSRPGVIVSVLCSRENLDMMRKTIFRQSTAVGFREQTVNRLSLRRTVKTEQTEKGPVRRKTVFWGGAELRSKIEFDDCARIARENGISLAEAAAFAGDRERVNDK
ncbi:MAG: nickel pincer cofactor biosynthesis protein LarC [Treponema sp.]|jgi:uncharacterized protein (TIGR00299 family) protein|nr:nickel pincer cofactor biosynthesis protein LarC [Treponema sp.]